MLALVTAPILLLVVFAKVLALKLPSSVTLQATVFEPASKLSGVQTSLKPLSPLLNSSLVADAALAMNARSASTARIAKRIFLRIRLEEGVSGD
jgi:Holliday junction resolvasome RuvABC ATP-dependent DNA helicase subunit